MILFLRTTQLYNDMNTPRIRSYIKNMAINILIRRLIARLRWHLHFLDLFNTNRKKRTRDMCCLCVRAWVGIMYDHTVEFGDDTYAYLRIKSVKNRSFYHLLKCWMGILSHFMNGNYLVDLPTWRSKISNGKTLNGHIYVWNVKTLCIDKKNVNRCNDKRYRSVWLKHKEN